jgi:signal transduction histidine kinase
MKVRDKSKEQLIKELAEMRRQVAQMGKLREEFACNVASCQEALAKYEALAKAFPGIIYVCSSTYEIEFVNERGLDRTGHDPIGEKCYRAVHNLESVCPWCVGDRVSRGEMVSQEVLSPKDNRWYHSVHTPFRHPSGSYAKMAMLYDITERKLAEAERDGLIAELRSKNADLEMFSHAVSHDLKNPLITIKGLLKWIERDAIGGNIDRLKVNLNLVANAAARMEQLVGDLLEFSRIGSFYNRVDEVLFGELASDAVQMVSGSIGEKGVKVKIAPNLPSVRCDRSRLLQVLQNLIENAVKFMGVQSHPEIDIGARPDDSGTVFYVRDNGIGIDLADQARVFDLFTKLDEEANGTGLGLALVKRIVEIHGGRIWVESKGRGRGSTFFFTLGPTSVLPP